MSDSKAKAPYMLPRYILDALRNETSDIGEPMTPEEFKAILQPSLKGAAEKGLSRLCACAYNLKPGEVSHNGPETDIRAYISELEAMVPRWISVEERLPEPSTVVLTFTPDCMQDDQICLAVFNSGKWKDTAWSIHIDGCPAKGVTHWMPLPAPPAAG